MLSVYRFPPSARIEMTDAVADYPDSVESEVDRIWRSLGSGRAGDAPFDGNIVSAVEVAPDNLRVRTMPYRYFAAQKVRPELFEILRVRPVAVSGLLKCADGIVFGKRASTMTQNGGQWELVPSGAIDAGRADAAGIVDYQAQVLIELREEIGLPADAVRGLMPFCLIDDAESHVLDVGIAMKTGLTADQICRAHCDLATKEYSELRVIAAGTVDEFIERERPQLVEASEILVQEYHRTNDR